MYMERNRVPKGMARVRIGVGGVESLIEKMTFEQRLGKGEGTSYANYCRKSIVGVNQVTVSSRPLVMGLVGFVAGNRNHCRHTVGTCPYLFGTNLCQHLPLYLKAFAGFW